MPPLAAETLVVTLEDPEPVREGLGIARPPARGGKAGCAVFLDDADRNDPQYVRNIVSLHKEVRETVKDMLRIQDRAAGNVTENLNAQTINILKVELAKESPEVWARLRAKLMGGE